MKFGRFLKIFAIALAGFVGAIGIGIGVMAIAGVFSEPNIPPQEISFEFSEYKVDGDFTAKVVTTTEDVTKTEITLSLPESANVQEKDGRIYDETISIPKTVKIGEEFTVYLRKVINDSECNGEDWINGGVSVIRATSVNPDCESAKTTVYVDVPVHKIEVTTKVSSADDDSSIFVLDSVINAGLKFYPARSAYRYSLDGQGGKQLEYKNAYFMLASNNDECLSQIGTTNQFSAVKVGDNSKIIGYTFKSAIVEERVLKLYEDKSEDAKHAEIMAELERMSTDTSSESKNALKETKSISVVDIDVNKMTASGQINDVLVNSLYTLYANKDVSLLDDYSSSLGIKLLSDYDENVSLQNKLTNVGITFLYKQGNSYFNAINGENDVYNVVTIPKDSYSKSAQVTENDVNYTYFFPVITSSVDNYYWEFAVSRFCNEDSIYVKIKYFDNNEIQPISKSFSTKMIVSNPVSWNNLDDIEITIYDGAQPEYEEFDVKERAQVPVTNLYQTKKYFAYSNKGEDLSQIIYCGEPVEYVINSQTFNLYELTDGILKAKSQSAYGKEFNVMFTTIETYYTGEAKLDAQNRYIINQYSQDSFGAISSLNVKVNKTLKEITTNLQIENNEKLIIFEEAGVQNLAFVQNTVTPFYVEVGYNLNPDATLEEKQNEKNIFEQAIDNDKISIVAKVNDVETDIIKTISKTKQNVGDVLSCRFNLTIQELPVGLSEVDVQLFVRYDKGKAVPDEALVSTFNDNENFGYIEVYNGEATTFAYNINICDEGVYQTSETNPIVVSSEIGQTNNYINSISTEYTIDGTEISNKLFNVVDTTVDYTSLNIIQQDKHGQKPVSLSYTMESSNKSVLVVTGQNSITFTGTGSATLTLKNAEGEVRDVLYFNSIKEGYVSKISKLVENVNSNMATKSMQTEYEYNPMDNSQGYDFPQITIPVVGYAGSVITFNNTAQEQELNLITYEYTYQINNADKIEDKVGKLTAKTVFELVDSNDMLLQENGFVDFVFENQESSRITSIKFLKDFGQRKFIQFLVTVKELGISQIVELKIEPNVSISLTPKDNPSAQSSIGMQTYNGVYADSVYKVELQIQYNVTSAWDTNIITDSSEYSFFVYDVENENQRSLLGLSPAGEEYAYILKIVDISTDTAKEITKTQTISRQDLTQSLYKYEVYIVFVSQNTNGNGFKKLELSFEKSNVYVGVDTQKSLYLNINPNVKVDISTTDLYLTTKFENTSGTNVYGECLLYGEGAPFTLSRLVNNFDTPDASEALLNKEITVELTSGEGLYINKENDAFKLYSTSKISDKKVAQIVIKYNGVQVGNAIDINIYPNITRNSEVNYWVKYDGEYYLKLVNGKQYSFENILSAFNYSYDFTSSEPVLKFIQNDYLTIENNTVTVSGAQDKIITHENLVCTVYLPNNTMENGEILGDNITFKIILLPGELPFVAYKNADGDLIDIKDEDLKDLLDVNYLVDNDYYFTLTNAGNDAGTNVLFKIGEDGTPSGIGIQKFTDASYYVENLDKDDKNIYAWFDNTNKVLKTEAVGKDTYVILYSALSLSADALKIPYLIKIQKELEIRTYYPYMSQASSNTTEIVGNKMIAENFVYDMEYLSFDDKGQAKVDMLETFNQEIPNHANGKRFVIGKNNIDGKFQEETLSTDINFDVTELYYYYYGWKKAENIHTYATFGESSLDKGLLTINKNDAEKIRLKIEITTTNGIIGWYYVSVGEVPNLILRENINDVFTLDIQNINLKANQEYDISQGKYRLDKSVSNVVTNVSSELCFYSPAELLAEHPLVIDRVNKIITTESTTSNWRTKLLFFTKYGLLKTVDVEVISNYNVEVAETVLHKNTEENVYEIISGNVIQIADTFKIAKDNTTDKFDITCSNVEILNSTLSQVYAVGNDTIKVGAVDKTTILTINLTLNFTDGEEKTYNFEFNLKIIPAIEVNSLNGQPISDFNMLGLEDIKAGETVEKDILSELLRFNGSEDFNFDKWYSNVYTNKLGLFEVILISENVTGSFSANVIKNTEGKYVVEITNSEVANETRVAFKLVFKNIINANGDAIEFLKVYFTYVVTPNFKLKVNYPIANNKEDLTVAGESFKYAENAEFDLQGTSLLSDYPRIQILDVNTNEENATYKNDIYISTNSAKVFKKDGITAVNGKYVSLNEAKFVFKDLEELLTNIQFGIYYKIPDTESYIALGNYNLVVSKDNIFSVTAINFNTENTRNDKQNPESIYIGNNDNILDRFRVEFKIPVDAKIDNTVYAKIQQVGGAQVESKEVAISKDSQGTSYVAWIILGQSGASFVNSDIDYRLYTKQEDGTEIDLTEEQKFNLEFTIRSRITLSYLNVVDSLGKTQPEEIDFFKAYNVLDVASINLNVTTLNATETTESIQEQSIKIKNETTALSTYYVDYKFDIDFETTKTSLSTGQSTSVIHNTSELLDKNYMSSLNMKHISNGAYYKENDFSKNGLYVSIDSSTISNKFTDASYTGPLTTGYLRINQVESILNDGVVYDYTFLAMGAPKETSVTVTLKLTVNYENIKKDFVFTFVVSNDYEEEYLRNQDNTLNTATNRNYIRMTNQNISFATIGSVTKQDNFIYIAHKNDITGGQKGNVAPYFSIRYDQGAEFIEKLVNATDLVFRFVDVEIGNVNIDMVFTDAYGYTFTYYLTIVAKYNPIYNGGDLSIFEQDTVQIINNGSAKDPDVDVVIPITLQQRDTSDRPLSFDGFLGKISIEFTPDNENIKENDSFKNLIALRDNDKFKIGLIDESCFTTVGSSSITGKLLIKITDNGKIVDIVIPTIIKERYSLQASSTPYVRDGVAFSLLDIVDVVDNKTSVPIASRTLTDVTSVYLNYSLKDKDNKDVLIEKVSGYFTIGIEARNLSNNTVMRVALPDASNHSYTSLQNLFELESLKNYQFRLIYWLTTGDGNDDSCKQITCTPTGSTTPSAYIINSETDDKAHTGLSTAITITTQDKGKDKDGKETIITNTYTFTIQNCYSMEDQTFTIGLRQLDNNQNIPINFYEESNSSRKTLNVVADKTELRSYSLREKGIIQKGEHVVLYTNSESGIVKGLSNADCASLKGIKFKSVSGGDIITNGFKVTKNLSPDEQFKTSADGNNVLYQDGQLNVGVEYGIVDNVATKTSDNFKAPVWITLKYVDVDTSNAYGSDTLRKVYNYGTRENININSWAGTTTTRPFTLVPGYTTVTSFDDNADNTLSGNKDDFKFAINTSQSTSGVSNYVTITPDGILTLHDLFDFNNNYIAIDVKVKYGEAKNVSQLIKTVLVAFKDVNNLNLTVKAIKKQLVVDVVRGQAKLGDILRMLEVSDGTDSLWNGTAIKDTFGDKLYVKDANGKEWDFGGSEDNIINVSIINVVTNVKTTNLEIGYKVGENIKYTTIIEGIECISVSDSYASVASSSYNFDADGYDTDDNIEAAIKDAIKQKTKIKNIYGYMENCNDVFDKEGLQCVVNESTSASKTNGEYKIYNVKFGNDTSDDAYGTVKVHAYKNDNVLQLSNTLTDVNVGESKDVLNLDIYGYKETTVTNGGVTETTKHIIIDNSNIPEEFKSETDETKFNVLKNNIEQLSILEIKDQKFYIKCDDFGVGDIITLRYIKSIGSVITTIDYNFAFENMSVNSEISTRIIDIDGNNAKLNILDYYNIAKSINKDKLLVKLESSDAEVLNYVSLIKDGENYKLKFIKATDKNLDFKIVIYISYINHDGTLKELTLYENTYSISKISEVPVTPETGA